MLSCVVHTGGGVLFQGHPGGGGSSLPILPQGHSVDPHAAGNVELAHGGNVDQSRLLQGKDGGLQVRQQGAESPNL